MSRTYRVKSDVEPTVRVYRPVNGVVPSGRPPMIFRPKTAAAPFSYRLSDSSAVCTEMPSSAIPMETVGEQKVPEVVQQQQQQQQQPSTWQPQPGSQVCPDVEVEERDKYAFDMSQPYIPVNPFIQSRSSLDLVAARLPAIPDQVKKYLYSPFVPDKFAPTEFLKDVPPPYGPKIKRYLDLKNAHPLDDRVVFVGGLEGIDETAEDDAILPDEERSDPHRYYIDGSCRHLISVTTFLHAFFEHFDPIKRSESTFATKTFADQKHRPAYKYYGCKSPADIRACWQRNARLGTKMHSNIECHLNGEPYTVCPENIKPFQQFQKLFSDQDWAHWEPFRTEWSVFDEETLLCGQIDLCGMIDRPTGKIVIVDWKRSENISDCSFERFGGKGYSANISGYGVCSGLENCNYIHYSLQLNIYAYLLWKNYGLTTVKMFILQFHPKNKDNLPGIFKVRHMFPVVEEMMACRKIVLRQHGVIPPAPDM